MKKVFSILLALALLAIAGYAMADAEQKVPLELAEKTGNIVLEKSTCTSYGSALMAIASEADAPKGAKIVTDDKGNLYYEAVIDMIEHEFEYVTAGSPVCNAGGAITKICKKCHTTDGDYVSKDATIHDYGTWTVLYESTCTEKGLKVRICNRCLAEQYVTLDLAKHNKKACTEEQLKKFDKKNTPATCTTEGKKWVICSVCEGNATLEEKTVKALGHDYDLTKTPATKETFKEPTCFETGFAKYICTRCKSTKEADIKTIVLPMTAHKLVEDKANSKKPTCTETGIAAVKCDNKDCKFVKQDPKVYPEIIIPATGHKWSDWKVVVAPSETTKGIWERYCVNKDCKVPAEHFVGDKLDNAERTNGMKEVDGEWIYVENDKPVKKTGFVEFEGGMFLVVDGKLEKVTTLYECADGTFVLLNDGKVSSYTGLFQYDGAWFYLANGKVATNVCGLQKHDGAEFVVANGQVLTGLNGLWQDHNSTEWFYIAAGKKTTYTGLAQYDGAWFYVTNGKLDTTFCGEVEYDGATFTVVNGMLAL